MTQAPRRTRAVLWVLVALFFGPLLVSYGWYFLFDGVTVESSAQHGELIQPPRPLPDVPLAGTPQADTSGELFTGHWSLVYFSPDACDAHCRERHYQLRQLRLTLGRHAARVQRVWLHTGSEPDAEWMQSEHPGLVAVSMDDPALSELLAEFPANGMALEAGDAVFLVDPLGNLIMRYPPEATLRGMRDDLERLLRLSRIG